MIERADQLVLNYVSAAADAAHGVLRPDQRLDFVKRLRARIEDERHGSQNARQVAKVIARFGDPVALVQREVRRLAEAAQAPAGAVSAAERAAGPGGVTVSFPTVVDDAPMPPVVGSPAARAAGKWADRPPGRGLPFAGLRRTAMSGANPMATQGRDARTIVKEHPRETLAMAILVMAALLVPFDLPAVAIFRLPVLVWALGAVLVLFSDGWAVRDRLIGIGAPLLGYLVGGVLVGGLRVEGEPGLRAFFVQFFDVSGVMFMIGAGVGVLWLAYRLLDVR
ncbi:hypothetical protein [Nonomuraea sp. NPDC048916]|uniref:hypothetical protein n=1 Tax=Nonomuraea sp. NPDC048916 TaxID=3154232 RepID=UPI0033EAAC28